MASGVVFQLIYTSPVHPSIRCGDDVTAHMSVRQIVNNHGRGIYGDNVGNPGSEQKKAGTGNWKFAD